MNEKKFIYPKPKKLNFELEEFDTAIKHRRYNCIFYSICLEHAAYFRWKSFSCKKCNLYYYENMTYQISKGKLKKFTILMLIKRKRDND